MGRLMAVDDDDNDVITDLDVSIFVFLPESWKATVEDPVKSNEKKRKFDVVVSMLLNDTELNMFLNLYCRLRFISQSNFFSLLLLFGRSVESFS
jgi:hypothetical protein